MKIKRMILLVLCKVFIPRSNGPPLRTICLNDVLSHFHHHLSHITATDHLNQCLSILYRLPTHGTIIDVNMNSGAVPPFPLFSTHLLNFLPFSLYSKLTSANTFNL